MLKFNGTKLLNKALFNGQEKGDFNNPMLIPFPVKKSCRVIQSQIFLISQTS